MDFFTTVESRHSTRSFTHQPIEENKIRQILEAANLAPSAGNLQAYQIFVVKDPARIASLAEAADQDWIAEAPVVLVFCADSSRSARKYGQRGRDLYALQDSTIAASYAQLAAASLGLGSCWVGAFSEEAILEILESPQNLLPVCLLPLGYPAEEPEPRERRKLKDLAREI
ncbi:MAG: nitroreductase family protein [Patescibacteria group bacterium]